MDLHSWIWQNIQEENIFSLYEKHSSSDLQQMAQSQETSAGQMEVGTNTTYPPTMSLMSLNPYSLHTGGTCVRLLHE